MACNEIFRDTVSVQIHIHMALLHGLGDTTISESSAQISMSFVAFMHGKVMKIARHQTVQLRNILSVTTVSHHLLCSPQNFTSSYFQDCAMLLQLLSTNNMACFHLFYRSCLDLSKATLQCSYLFVNVLFYRIQRPLQQLGVSLLTRACSVLEPEVC